MSLNVNNYSTLNSEHIWEGLYIHLRFQQTYTFDKLGEVRFWIWKLQMFHRRFAITTRILLCKFKRRKLENTRKEPNDTQNKTLG